MVKAKPRQGTVPKSLERHAQEAFDYIDWWDETERTIIIVGFRFGLGFVLGLELGLGLGLGVRG